MPQPNNTETRFEHPLRYPLLNCPACGSDHLEPVVENGTSDVHFFCHDCNRCWHVELGYVHRVSPDVCHGCKYASTCRRVYQADHEQTTE